MDTNVKKNDVEDDDVKHKRKSVIVAGEELCNGHEGEEEKEEEIHEEFRCCVCLDLLYKPVVLGCGHISCFWCVYNAMNHWQASRCPVCRHPYNHFPSICQLLHFLLQKLYPYAYKRRGKEVSEEENKNGYFSPQFDDFQPYGLKQNGESISAKNNPFSEAQPLEGEDYLDANSSEHFVHNRGGNLVQPSAASTSCNDTIKVQKSRAHEKFGIHGRIAVSDLLCASCEKLLYRPVVLNCGHVYCESCIIVPRNETWKCKQCGSLHPNGFPNVCLVLHHFFEEQFPNLYLERQEACQGQILRQQQAQRQSTELPCLLSDFHTLLQPGNGLSVHFFVGCDCCGLTPIIGKRYKCMDCTEKIGFDLCEECFENPVKLPGRFNQQHKPDHRFAIVEAKSLRELLASFNDERAQEHLEDPASPPTYPDDVPQDPRASSSETDDVYVITNRLSLNPEEDDSDGTTS